MSDLSGEPKPGATPAETSGTALDRKFSAFSASVKQTSTRGDHELVLSGVTFASADLDFARALAHLTIHHGGEIAGSQFNPAVVSSPDDVRDLLLAVLPERLPFDQHQRAEITLFVSHPGQQPLGYAGVKSLDEILALTGVQIERRMRETGGSVAKEKDSEGNSVDGAWYPEVDGEGKVINPRDRFVPLANIASVPREQFEAASATNSVTVIIEKDEKSGRPTVRTIFPGQNAPPFPVKFDETDNFLSGPSKDFWNDHAFIQTV